MATKTINTNIAESRILAFVAENPNTTARQIAESLSLPKGTVAPTLKALKAAERIREAGTLKQIDPETGDFLRGRPAKLLRATDKGRAAAKRIAAKAAKLAEQQAETETTEQAEAVAA